LQCTSPWATRPRRRSLRQDTIATRRCPCRRPARNLISLASARALAPGANSRARAHGP
jgi:hypothetical protein